ncbi:uL15 family ribosomal protein [Candidatus Woesearchaeota archaeon]|nr:uL15 family ribosomal protein [Candidatus Woesearchaeota archaeon]
MDHKRKKNTRQRGSKTHGWGAMKKHRGAGHRGGRGAAGSGKRGDAKKPSIWRSTNYAGKRGFISKHRSPRSPVTIAHLESHAVTLREEGFLIGESIDLAKAGYTKLLATGKPSRKWAITVAAATPRAIEKVKKAGGTVTLAVGPGEGTAPATAEDA